MVSSYSIRWFACLCLLLLPEMAGAGVSDLKQGLEAMTADISSDGGIKIVSLDKKETLFSKNEDEVLNPASVVKLVTAAASLKYLGPDFRFHTKFYLTGNNDLFIVGEGDPSIVIEEMRMIADGLIRKGVKNVRHIIVNDSYFDGYTSPGLGNGKEHYSSYTGALSLNYNRIRLKVTPARRIGDFATVEADAGGVEIPVVSKVVTVRARGGSYLNFEAPTGENDLHFIVDGQIGAGRRGVERESHAPLPPLYFAEVLMALMREGGCYFSGGIYRGSDLEGARLVVDHESRPLASIIGDMNKFSNNFIAEQLLKVLGARYLGAPGNTAKGLSALKTYLGSLGISSSGYTIVNGSGLSYENRMSAAQFVRIIQDMFDSGRLWSAFENSLSVAGRDGTLKRKYRTRLLADKLKAKTGSVNHVRAIAGVVPSKSGETIGFAILLNNGDASGSIQLRNNILETIAGFER